MLIGSIADNLIMHLCVIHIAVWEVDVTGVHVEGNDRGIVDNVARIRDLNVRTIVRVADRPGRESSQEGTRCPRDRA